MGECAVSGPTMKMVTVFLQQSGQKMQNNPDMLHSGKFILIIIQKQDTVVVTEYYRFFPGLCIPWQKPHSYAPQHTYSLKKLLL